MGTTNVGKERLIELNLARFHFASVISTHIPDVGDKYRKEIDKARKDICELIRKQRCAHLMLLLAWHDAGTFDCITKTGGANGSIRNEKELNHSCNKGLKPALDLCEEIKSKHPVISYADIIQLAGVIAVEVSGGPCIYFIPGRKDSSKSPKEGRLPNPKKGSIHMREVFTRMGFWTREIVCLLGPYILASAHAHRSDFDGFWATLPFKSDNSYFVELQNRKKEGLLKLPMDLALLEDDRFNIYVSQYAKFEKSFIEEYAAYHKKLSELGFIEYSLPLSVAKERSYAPIVGVVAVVAIIMLVGYLFLK